MWRPLYLVALLLALCAASSCGGAPDAFGSRFPDNVDSDIARVVHRIASARPRKPAPVAVGVSGAPARLYAYDLENDRLLWRERTETSYPPQVAGDVVVTQEPSGIVGRALQDGASQFALRDHDLTLNGADGIGSRVLLTMTGLEGGEQRSEVIYVRDGTIQWQRELRFAAGAPALADGLALVPWGTQFVSALSLEDGVEVARLRLRDGVVGHVLVRDGSAYVGQDTVMKLTSRAASGTRDTLPRYTLPDKSLPGAPRLLRDVYQPPPFQPLDRASHHILLSWQPGAARESGLQLENDVLYLTFYRMVFALDPRTLEPRWVTRHPQRIVGATSGEAGLWIIDATGSILLLKADTGRALPRARTGLATRFARLRTAGLAVGRDSQQAASGASAEQGLASQLAAAARESDAQLVPARLFAVESLARMERPEATGVLLELCDDRKLTASVREASCEGLATRDNGERYVLQALDRHASYLDDRRAPPIGPLARAAVRMNASAARPRLIAHLNDPHTHVSQLPSLIGALTEIGGEQAADALERFVLLYHADAPNAELIEALAAAAKGLAELRGQDAFETLRWVANDPMATPAVRERMAIALAPLEHERRAAEAAEARAENEDTEADDPEEASTSDEPRRPEHFTDGLLARILGPVEDELLACLTATGKRYASARVVLVVEDGHLDTVSVVPEALQECIEPIVRSREYPQTRSGRRQRVTYMVAY